MGEETLVQGRKGGPTQNRGLGYPHYFLPDFLYSDIEKIMMAISGEEVRGKEEAFFG